MVHVQPLLRRQTENHRSGSLITGLTSRFSSTTKVQCSGSCRGSCCCSSLRSSVASRTNPNRGIPHERQTWALRMDGFFKLSSCASTIHWHLVSGRPSSFSSRHEHVLRADRSRCPRLERCWSSFSRRGRASPLQRLQCSSLNGKYIAWPRAGRAPVETPMDER